MGIFPGALSMARVPAEIFSLRYPIDWGTKFAFQVEILTWEAHFPVLRKIVKPQIT